MASIKHPFTGGTLLYKWDAVGDYWPKRLLHIPTMTSVERAGVSIYNGVDRPEYSILTYTWGRWKIRDASGGPALPVKGTPWKIPAIKPEHFTVESFEKVIGRLGEDGIEWAWVDIACIDQENAEDNAYEVGRQASIFKNAKKVFVWLSHIETETLQAAVKEIVDHGVNLSQFVNSGDWDPKAQLNLQEPVQLRYTTMSHSLAEMVSTLSIAFAKIFGDPWFSSLWTLQEVVLRNDALALSKEANPVLWMDDMYMFLTMFINHCQNVFTDLDFFLRKLADHQRYLSLEDEQTFINNSQELRDQVSKISQYISQAGFYYLFSLNPNVQYGTARYRTTSRPEDRVYAIMQIYNLRVGKSIRPQDNPTLQELKNEFSQAIIRRCPILGQLFIHTGPPEDRKSWRITEQSTVPYELLIYKEPIPECSFEFELDGSARTHGPCCLYDDLRTALEGEDDFIELMLDKDIGDKLQANPMGESATVSRFRRTQQKSLPRWMIYAQLGKQNLWVLKLGTIQGVYDPVIKGQSRSCIGLLLCRKEWNAEKEWLDVPYRRVGVFTWDLRGPLLNHKGLDTLQWVDRSIQLH
ncbi:hypothetical protein ABW19_dt0204216 [Dactylella cylindrospora]|nr:hypothetical protein ABW19_dt0204216 [Dactylella cylindrospora]